MKRNLILMGVLILLVSCNSNKNKIETYISNNVFDHNVEITGDIVVDSAFCPLTHLEQASIQLMGYQGLLLRMLDENPDSAYSLANSLKLQLGGNKGFASLAYPTGSNNRLAYMAKCSVDGSERMVTFFKYVDDDEIEQSSLDVDETIDSLMVSYNHLMDGIKVILADKKSE